MQPSQTSANVEQNRVASVHAPDGDDEDHMSAAHMPLRLHGEFLGDLITVGHRVMLFTVRPDLASLDGGTFDDADAARDAVLERLAPTPLFRGIAA